MRDTSEMLSVGDEAPEFKGKDHEGNSVALSDFKDKKNVVLVFYPGNNTPGCTKQLCAIRDDWSNFEDEETVVFGVNPADQESHSDFASKYNFPFPLLVDESGEIIRSFGCRGLMGITKRTVYVIDKSGKIVFAERGMPANSAILASLKSS